RERMRLIELVRPRAALAPALDLLPVLREPDDAIDGRAVADGDEDVAVWRDEDVVRLEAAVGRGCAARLANRQQHLPVGAELEHLMPLGRAGRRGGRRSVSTRSALAPRSALAAHAALRPWRVVLAVGHPDVALPVD